MSWQSIREFTRRHNLSSSTVRRHITQGKISAKKFGRNWYVEYPDRTDTGGPSVPYGTQGESLEAFSQTSLAHSPTTSSDNLQSVVEFSSKALNHYLMLHEKLMDEKDLRLKEREAELSEKKQTVAELESYVQMLEAELEKMKDRPEGWR